LLKSFIGDVSVRGMATRADYAHERNTVSGGP
jgi:hypothetical protein